MLAASMLLVSFMPHAPLRRAAPRLERQRQVSLDASRTERIFRTLPGESQTGGAGGQSTYDALLALERRWDAMKAGNTPPVPELVRDTHADRPSGLDTMDFDVVVAGGNIGVLLATALALRGLRVAIVEAGKLRGREQVRVTSFHSREDEHTAEHSFVCRIGTRRARRWRSWLPLVSSARRSWLA